MLNKMCNLKTTAGMKIILHFLRVNIVAHKAISITIFQLNAHTQKNLWFCIKFVPVGYYLFLFLVLVLCAKNCRRSTYGYYSMRHCDRGKVLIKLKVAI